MASVAYFKPALSVPLVSVLILSLRRFVASRTTHLIYKASTVTHHSRNEYSTGNAVSLMEASLRK